MPELTNIARFGENLHTRVANPSTLLQFYKRKAAPRRKTKVDINMPDDNSDDEAAPNQRLEKLKKKSDQLASEEGMTEKEKADSISKLMVHSIMKTFLIKAETTTPRKAMTARLPSLPKGLSASKLPKTLPLTWTQVHHKPELAPAVSPSTVS